MNRDVWPRCGCVTRRKHLCKNNRKAEIAFFFLSCPPSPLCVSRSSRCINCHRSFEALLLFHTFLSTQVSTTTENLASWRIFHWLAVYVPFIRASSAPPLSAYNTHLPFHPSRRSGFIFSGGTLHWDRITWVFPRLATDEKINAPWFWHFLKGRSSLTSPAAWGSSGLSVQRRHFLHPDWDIENKCV